jgi:hypothetical protein
MGYLELSAVRCWVNLLRRKWTRGERTDTALTTMGSITDIITPLVIGVDPRIVTAVALGTAIAVGREIVIAARIRRVPYLTLGGETGPVSKHLTSKLISFVYPSPTLVHS